MPPTGLDDALKLEAIYYSAPIPRNLAVLTILGTVFDRIHFPGVHIPKSGFDQKDLDAEIARIAALSGDRDDSIMLAILQFVRHASILDGFCVFSANSVDEVFTTSDKIPQSMVKDLYHAIHGPSPANWEPLFSTSHHKMPPGSDEHITYRGEYHYLAGALLESARHKIPLVNDLPSLPVPGIESPVRDANVLSAILAMECVKVALPTLPMLTPEDLMEFRAENKESLRAFRRSMLRYAGDLRGKIRDATPQEIDAETEFFVRTEIVPVLDELRASMERPATPWYKRAINLIKVSPALAVAFMTMDTHSAIAKVLTTYAGEFFTEMMSKGDQRDAVKRSGLYYLLKLQTLQPGE